MACETGFRRFGVRALITLASCAIGVATSIAAEADAMAQPPPPPAAVAPATLAGDLLAYTVNVTVRVARADDSAKKAEEIAKRYGGRLIERSDGDLKVLVPVGQMDPAVRDLAALGVELGRSVNVTNVTEPWLDAQGKLRSSALSRQRLWAMGRLATGGVKDPILLQRYIAQADNETASLRARIHSLETQASQVLIGVRLEPTEGVEVETIQRFELPFPWLSRMGLDRLMDMQPTYEPPDEPTYYLNDEGEVSVGLSVMAPEDKASFGDTSMTIAGAMKVRGMFDTDPVGPAVGMDLQLGSGTDGGLLYDLRMLVGPGLTIGRHFSMGALTGAGISGLTGGHVPFGIDFPVEVFAATDVTRYAQVRLWGRSSWIVASDERQNGADHAPFGDELLSGASFVIGEDSASENRERLGLSLGVTYGELLGTRVMGLSLGFGAGFGDRRMND